MSGICFMSLQVFCEKLRILNEIVNGIKEPLVNVLLLSTKSA